MSDAASRFTILRAMDNRHLWRRWFRESASWEPWRAFLSALFGLTMSDEALDLFRRCTGRASPRAGGYSEAWLVCGRRAGKSFVLALVACYLAACRDWRPHLAPGEVGTIKIIATDRRQARVIHRYCRALLSEVPTLKELVVRETETEIELSNSVLLEIQAASFRSVRGYSLIAALCDEIAFWRSDETSANPDGEILAAIRPAMATIPGAMLLCASSPYARRGELWNAARRWHGADAAPALVWHAPTRTMNPTVPQRIIDEALEADPAKGASEFLAEFRADIETFIRREVVDAAIVPDRFELPPLGAERYVAFVDPSGGSSDSMTLAIAHRDPDHRVVLDAVRERRPPFSPEDVVDEFAATLRAYRIAKIQGDRYGGEWPREQFSKRGIRYEPAERTKSDLYRELLPLLNSGKVELLDNSRLISQLCSLERRTARGGRDSIDHPPGAHDDVANAAAGAIGLLGTKRAVIITTEMLQRARSYRHAPAWP